METKHCRNVLVDLQVWLGYERVYTVEPVGYSGGLALFCKNTVKLDLLFADKNLMDFQVQFGEAQFFVSCVYGEPSQSGKEVVWERISRIGVNRKASWCMVGDFNDILNNEEKVGGSLRSEGSFTAFREMLSGCGMEEFRSHGNRFSWGGMRWKKWIQCCLDRGFSNKEWMSQFPISSQIFLDKRGSDHRPVLISLIQAQDSYRGHFKFDKRFLFQPDIRREVVSAWAGNRNEENLKVADRLRECRRKLSRWKKKRIFNAKDKIQLIERQLEWCQSRNFHCGHRINQLKRELMQAHKEEELFWQQKTRLKWMKKGDRSTKVFFAAVKTNMARLRISRLLNSEGEPQFSEAAKADVAVKYFDNLFKSSNPADYSRLFLDMVPRVTDRMNQSLSSRVTNEEIRKAVFDIRSSAAPGPDGMTGLFFQQYWETVGDKVTREVQEFFETGEIQKEWNFTYLCLLPKTQCPDQMSDLRPISLCSVLYKIISKVLVQRLQPLLPDIVSINQSAFVRDRLISDNIIIAHEAVHALRTHKVVSQDFMGVKTDMSKAYDRLEWSYLRCLLLALGFAKIWVDWVMVCVSSVTYAVLMNDQPYGLIHPQRGIRQGDPLSPFLFVLCTEGLTHMLNVAEAEGRLEGLRFSDAGPSVHHLLFADDSLFLCKACRAQSRTLQEILKLYGDSTGQVINLQKSSISFGVNVDPSIKAEIQGVLGIVNEGGASKYLGLPECFSGSKIEMLSCIKERTKAGISSWYLGKLSQAGKELLIKAVGSALPVYAMTCFKLPITVCKNISSTLAAFWWGSDEHLRKVHWVAWDKLCLPKNLGGVGFRELRAFNQALVAKQAWKIVSDPTSLLARFLKSRYFADLTFLEAHIGSRPSYAWRSILWGRELIEKGIRKRVGNGQTVKVWAERWIEDEQEGLRAPWIKNYTFDVMLMASSLIDMGSRRWNVQALEDIFVPGDVQILLKNQPVVSVEDFWVWTFNKNGVYSVKSGYWLASRSNNPDLFREAESQPSLNILKEQVWKVQTMPKIRMFLWKALSSALPVVDLIRARGMAIDERCQICGLVGESINHILFTCTVARQCWALPDIPLPENGFHDSSIFVNLQFLFMLSKNHRVRREVRIIWPWLLWYLWKNRNLLLFEGTRFNGLEVVSKAYEESSLWFLAQEVDRELEEVEGGLTVRTPLKWKRPEQGWLKCNIGMDWAKKRGLVGGAWVLRDTTGMVLMHGRDAFVGVKELMEAKMCVVMWALESLRCLHINRVVIAVDMKDIVEAVTNPKNWKTLQFHAGEIRIRLEAILGSHLVLESKDANRGATFIVQNVTHLNMLQSYVASGHPRWLQEFFVNESSEASV